jgi:hypothetical protein
MKTIEEHVNQLSTEDLKKIAIEKFARMSGFEVRDLLRNIQLNTKLERNGLRDYFMERYKAQKKELQRLELWNPEYDKHYRLAINGELDISKVK